MKINAKGDLITAISFIYKTTVKYSKMTQYFRITEIEI